MLFIWITPAFLDESRHVIERHRVRVVGGFSIRPLCPLRAAYFCMLRYNKKPCSFRSCKKYGPNTLLDGVYVGTDTGWADVGC